MAPGVKSVPYQTWGSIHCGDPLGNNRATKNAICRQSVGNDGWKNEASVDVPLTCSFLTQLL